MRKNRSLTDPCPACGGQGVKRITGSHTMHTRNIPCGRCNGSGEVPLPLEQPQSLIKKIVEHIKKSSTQH